MSYEPKWMLRIEDVRGIFMILVSRGNSVEGSASADDFDTALSMGKELYEDCRAYQMQKESQQREKGRI